MAEEVGIYEEVTHAGPYTLASAFAAGTVAGMVSKIIGHPFDTVKVRLQTTQQYKGATDCLYKMVKNEGVSSLYKGLASPLLGAVVEIAVIFAANEQIKSTIQRWNHNEIAKTAPAQIEPFKAAVVPSAATKLSLPQLVIAGGLAGTCVSFVITPVELIKCRLQVQEGSKHNTKHQYTGPVDVIKQTIKKEGPLALFRGHSATMARETFGNMVWFGVYEATCAALVPHGKTREELSNLSKAFAGGLAGVLFWAVPFPTDVVKSVMQTMQHSSNISRGPGRPAAITFTNVFKHILKTQGITGLYRGFGVTALRAAPCNGAIFLCYELLFKFLSPKT